MSMAAFLLIATLQFQYDILSQKSYLVNSIKTTF
jgi:hypothetical protein